MKESYKDVGTPETRMIEECAEVIHSLCKVDRFGYDNFNPENGVHNIDYLLSELDDLDLAMSNLRMHLNRLEVD